MPRGKVTFKETVLDLELENVEMTVGSEIIKAGRIKASLDVADLLRVQLPDLTRGDVDGILFVDCGHKKIMCIKEIRQMTGWNLKDSKDFVEAAPKVLPGIKMNVCAEEAYEKLSVHGARVEIHHGTARTPTVLDRFREMLQEALAKQT